MINNKIKTQIKKWQGGKKGYTFIGSCFASTSQNIASPGHSLADSEPTGT
jgi:hypothetical protein